jgi:GT2 family glycosyltransferase
MEGSEINGAFILIPVSDSIPGMFLASFARVYSALAARGFALALFSSDKVPLDLARDQLLSSALGAGQPLKYVIWLDADMKVEGSQVLELIDFAERNPEADVVSGLYFKKIHYDPVCFRMAGGGIKPYMPKSEMPEEVDAVGLGCAVMKTAALKKALQGKTHFFWFGKENSEDVNFCGLLRENGLRIFVLPSVVVPHQGGFVGKGHYLKLKGE